MQALFAAARRSAGALVIWHTFRIAWRLCWRDWRSGALGLLMAALAVAVTIITGISLFTDRLDRALSGESATFLAADRVISGSAPAPDDWLNQAHHQGLEIARLAAFPSMVFTQQRNQLVAVKAVSAGYPLRGRLLVADKPFVQGEVSFDIPKSGEVWLDSRLFPSLGVGIGEQIDLGYQSFRITKALIAEPDRGGDVFGLGPRLLMNIADIPSTGLIQPGSRVNHRLLLAGSESDLEDFYQWLRPKLPDLAFVWQDIHNSSPSIGSALEKAERFLLLGGLIGVILAGVAVALVANRYSRQHFDQVAMLKTFGQTPRDIMALYLTKLLIIGVLAIALGLVVGFLLQQVMFSVFGQLLNIQLPKSSFQPFVVGAVSGLVCLLAFAVPPLLALGQVPPVQVLRRDFTFAGSSAILYFAGIAGILLLLLWYSQNLLLTFALFLGTVAAVGLLLLLAKVFLRLARRFGGQISSAWQLAMTGMQRRSLDSGLQLLAFSLVIMLVMILSLVRTELLVDWKQQLPEDAANHFLINVTTQDRPALEALLSENTQGPLQFFSSMRGRMTHISGEPIEERESRYRNLVEEGPRVSAERNLTWSKEFPEDNQLIAGQWWDEQGENKPLISLESYMAEVLNAQIGETITFQIADRVIEAELASIRLVKWDGFKPNFYIIFSPGVLDAFAGTWMTSFYLPPDRKSFLNDLLSRFPTVTVIEIDRLISQVQLLIERMGLAIQLVLVLVVLAGGFVLIASINATLDQRRREYALLLALGSDRGLLLRALLIEFAALGAVAGLVAAVISEVVAALVWQEVFFIDPTAHPALWWLGPVMGLVVVAILGFSVTRKSLYSSPLLTLREGLNG